MLVRKWLLSRKFIVSPCPAHGATAMTAAPSGRLKLHGFTLTELLVVIAILVVLAGVGLPGLGRMQASAEREAEATRIMKILTACEKYHLEFGFYPLETLPPPTSSAKVGVNFPRTERNLVRQNPLTIISEGEYNGKIPAPDSGAPGSPYSTAVAAQNSYRITESTTGPERRWYYADNLVNCLMGDLPNAVDFAGKPRGYCGKYLTDSDFPLLGDPNDRDNAPAPKDTNLGQYLDLQVFLDYWGQQPLFYWLRYRDEWSASAKKFNTPTSTSGKQKLVPEIWSAGNDGKMTGYNWFGSENNKKSGAVSATNGVNGAEYCARSAAYTMDEPAGEASCVWGHKYDRDNVGGDINRIRK